MTACIHLRHMIPFRSSVHGPALAQCTDTVTGSTAPIAFRQRPRKVVVSDGWNRGSGIRGIQKDLQRSAPARGRGAEALPSSEE